jgi:GR25 family glycosyltransferase involved in LPS biosynthesis
MILDIQSIPKYVINLKHRTDRLEQIKSEMQWVFTDTSFNLFEGIVHRKPMIGCGSSHLAIIQLAKERNLPYVLLIEDDCIFPAKEKVLPYINEAFKEVPDDFNIVFGGLYQAKLTNPINNYWMRVRQYSSTHFYIVNSKCYDLILNGWDKNSHIDRWLAEHVDNSYCTKKMWAIQSVGYSDNVCQNIDYSHMLEKSGFTLL